MTITYQLTVTALCPNAPHVRNHYQVSVESSTLIWTENLEAFADTLATETLSQEDLTQRFALKFPGTKVTITGQHGRVRVVSQDEAVNG